MGTRAIVGISNKYHQNIKCVMVSYDGGFDNVGKILYQHYNNYEMAKQIVELGNLTSIAPNFGNTAKSCWEHINMPFDKQGIVSHMRDCSGWNDYPTDCSYETNKPRHYANFKELKNDYDSVRYFYIHDTIQWRTASYETNFRFVPLGRAIKILI